MSRTLLTSLTILACLLVCDSFVGKAKISQWKRNTHAVILMTKYPNNELRLGQSTIGHVPTQLENIVLESALESVNQKLLEEDKISYEWFASFLESFFIENATPDVSRAVPVTEQNSVWLKLVETLIEHKAVTVERKYESQSSEKISMHFSHMVDPITIASLLLSARETTLKDMINQLPLILKESAEATHYATVFLQEGEGAAKRSRRPIIELSNAPPAIVANFNRLNMFVTNVALDQIRSRYVVSGNKLAQSYLEEFVQNIDSSQHLAKLLSASSHPKTVSSMNAMARAYTADHHNPGSPRHLIERLMYEGLKHSLDKKFGKRGSRLTDDTVDDEKKNPSKQRKTFAQRIADSIENDAAKDDVDIQAMAQDLIDIRASVADSCAQTVRDIMASDAAGSELQGFIRRIDERRVRIIGQNGAPAVDLHGSELEVRTTDSASDSPSMFLSFTNGTSSPTDPTSGNSNFNDTSSAAVSAGQPKSTAGGAGGTDFSLQGILNALFGGGESGGKKGWKQEEDSSQPKTDTDGAKKKTPVAILDPPDDKPPPPPRRRREDDGGDDAIERRNPVNYGEDAPEGELALFLNLPPDAMVHLVGQKIEDGQKLLCLEARSPTRGTFLRRWIKYEDAVNFITRTSAPDSDASSDTPESRYASSASNSGIVPDTNTYASYSGNNVPIAIADDEDDGSPFFGGGVPMM